MSNNNAPDVRARLDAIRQRRAAITPGKWFTLPRTVPNAVLKSGETAGIVETIADCQNQADADFVAAASKDIDKMLAIIDALLTERTTLPAPTADERLDGFGQRLVGILNDNMLDTDEMFEALSKLASEMRWAANTAPTAAGAAEPGNAAAKVGHVTVTLTDYDWSVLRSLLDKPLVSFRHPDETLERTLGKLIACEFVTEGSRGWRITPEGFQAVARQFGTTPPGESEGA